MISNCERIVSIQTQNGAEFIGESCSGFTGLPEIRAIFIKKSNSQVSVDYELPLSPALEVAQAPIVAPTEVEVKQQQQEQQNTTKVATKIERRSLRNRNRNKRRRTGSLVAENSLPPSAPTSEQEDQVPAPQPVHISQPVARIQQSESSDEGEDGINPNMIIPAEQLIQDYANEAKQTPMEFAATQDMEVELPATETREETSESDDSGTESDTEASSDEEDEEDEEESAKVETAPAEAISNTIETPKQQEKPENVDNSAMAVDTPQNDAESCKNSLNHSESASDFTDSSSEGSETDTESGSESESDEEQTLLEGNVPSPAVREEVAAPVVKRESDVDSDSSSSSGSDCSSSSEEEGDSKSKMEHLLMDSAKQKKDNLQTLPNKQMFEDQDVLKQKKGFIKGIAKSNKIRAVKPPPKKLKKPEGLTNNNGNTVSMNIDQEASELLKNPNAINELIGNDAQWE